jgi:hypothetical protein
MQLPLEYRLVETVTVTVYVSEIFHTSFLHGTLEDFHARNKVKMNSFDFVLSINKSFLIQLAD